MAAVAFLARLDVAPLSQDGFRAASAGIAEDMRMPAHQFAGERRHDVVEIETALFARELGVEDDLQEEVAELFAEGVRIAAADRGGDFFRFLAEAGDQRAMRLLAVPRASLGRAQPRHDAQEAVERARHGGGKGIRARAKDYSGALAAATKKRGIPQSRNRTL